MAKSLISPQNIVGMQKDRNINVSINILKRPKGYPQRNASEDAAFAVQHGLQFALLNQEQHALQQIAAEEPHTACRWEDIK